MIDENRGLIDFINNRPQPEPETGLNYGDTQPTMTLYQLTAKLLEVIEVVQDFDTRLGALESIAQGGMDSAHG